MKALKYILFVLYMIGLYFTEASLMFRGDSNLLFSVTWPLVMLISAFFSNLFLPSPFSNNLKPFISFIFICYVISLIHTITSPFPARYFYITLILPAFSCVFMYKIFVSGIKEGFFWVCIIIVYCLLLLFFFNVYKNNLISEYVSQNNAAYAILYFLPLLLCVKNKYVRYCAIFVTAVTLLFSMKRGGTLAFLLALIAYIYVSFFVLADKKNKFSYLLFISVVLIGGYDVINYFWGNQGVLLLERFQDDNTGSGRDVIYQTVVEMISNNSVIDYVFGHGLDGVARDGGFGTSSHNDYLEFLYDFGFLGLVALLIFVYNYIKTTINLIRSKSFYASPAVFALVVILVNSTISHIFFYSWYLLLFAIFFGYLYANINNNNYND